MALAIATFAMAGCVQEYMEVDPNKVPQASEIEPVASVNPETNEVTLSITNTGMVPVWSVENDAVNGKVVTKSYTGNNVSLVFNDKGEHTVYVKAYNSHGMSLGAKPFTFETTSYIAYDKGLAGWDPAEDGNLWVDANKDKITHYYAPGWSQIAEGPQVVKEGDDYIVTFSQATTDQWQAQFAFTELGIATSAGKYYDFQVVLKSNNALPGVTIKLTQADDDNIFYFADRHEVPANKDWAYQVANFEGKDIADLDLFFDFGGNPENTVVEIKQIIISEHKENHTVKDDSGKWDASADFNLWKNANLSTTTHYYAPGWSQIADGPGVEADNGKISLTFPEATTDQWQAQFAFCEIGIATSASKTYDFQVIVKSTTDQPGVTIKLTDASDDNVFYFADRHVIKAGEEYLYQVAGMPGQDIADLDMFFDFGGCPANSEIVLSDIILCEHQAEHVVAAEDPNRNTLFDPTAAENLWLGANTTEWTYYYAPGWSQTADPTVTADGNYYTVMLPEATTDQWQAQMFFNNLGISTSTGKLYDFQAVLKSNNDHPGVTVKLTSTASDDDFYFDGRHKLTAGEEYVYQMSNLEGKDIADMKLVLDFGGCAANTEIIIKDIIFQEHREK